VGIGLTGAVDAGLISLVTERNDPREEAAVGELLARGGASLAASGNRRFAVIGMDHLGSGDPQAALRLQVVLEEAAVDLGIIVLAVYDRSVLAPGIVRDAVQSHRLVLSNGVLGENLHRITPTALMAHRETALDVDSLLQSLGERRGQGEARGLLQEDAASRRLSEANELLQREIARRVQMEHILSASEERYRLLVEALPDCVLVHSGGSIVFANRAGLEMVRARSPEEVLGQSVMRFVHPESVGTVAARVRMMMEKGLRAPLMVERFLRLDGSDFFAEAIATPLVFEGKPSIQVVMRDITERRTAEADLQFKSFLADNAIDGITVRRVADGRIIYINDTMCSMTGLGRDELLGSDQRVFVPVEEREPVERHVQAIDREGRGIFETIVGHRDGRRFPVEVHSEVIRYGDVPVRVSVVRDISERRRAEERQRQLTEQLQRAQKMEAIGTLASGIAHDFNNILTGILGYADLILNQTSEADPFHKAATVIGRAAERGASLARKILMVARKEQMERHPVDLNLLVRGTAELLRKTLPPNIELVLNLREDLPRLMADPAQLDQVVLNLATNARDAMPRGGRLTIESEMATPGELEKGTCSPDSGGHIRLSVSDTGIGMDQATRQRVYDPFFTTKQAGKGTGLGLYIVHTAVSNHGGQIRLYSELGLGTRISVYLPVTAEEIGSEPEAPAPVTGGGRILVIDDEAAIREMCQDLLTHLGYTVTTAADGEEGLRLFTVAPDRYDLVLLDLVMPKLDGREVFDRLRGIKPDARVILCSGYSQAGFAGVQAMLEAGARRFVQKPFNLKTIGAAIREVMGETPC
jgi:PAS domain S-box-containing protein